MGTAKGLLSPLFGGLNRKAHKSPHCCGHFATFYIEIEQFFTILELFFADKTS